MITQTELKDFTPTQKYFIGFDSDGCVFDSMELKHKECFIPNIIKHYDLQSVSKYAREVAEFINLYSYWRGINRFPGLVMTLEMLAARPEVKERKAKIADVASIKRFIDGTKSLGNPALKQAIEKDNDPELKRLLRWSETVNNSVEEIVKGLPPFPFVTDCLTSLKGRADVMVVSATPAEALRREWEEHGIDKHVALIAGQELGKKEEQLGLTGGGKYPKENILMVGDALGDLKAAQAVGAMFFPVVPGREEESWRVLHQDVIDLFLTGKFTREMEGKYLSDFEKALPKTAPWQ